MKHHDESTEHEADTFPEFRETIALLRGAAPSVSPDFNARLRARLLRTSAQRAHHRTRPVLVRWAAVAAALVVGLLAGPILFDGGNSRRDPSLAWADVVRAMDRVKHFHVLTFADEPRNADLPPLYRIDLFHERPDRWRAQGLGFVQFGPDAKKLFSLADRKFVDPRTARTRLIPPEFVQAFAKDGLLPAILHVIFRGNPPAGEPVKSDDVASGEGIEVFDYANAPEQQWARIWVLKASRLPLRMHVYQPGSNDFLLVVFDYADPQPPEFFDPAAFEKTVRDNHIADPQEILNVGTRPVGGNKPRGSGQIHDARGGYTVPTLLRVLPNDRNEIVLVTNVVQNKAPAGVSLLDEGFDNVRDNWGNRYINAGARWGVGDKAVGEWFFTPLPPFKKMPGRRVLTADYTIRTAANGRGIEDTVLAEQSAAVPDEPTAPWPNGFTPAVAEYTLRQHTRATGTLAQQRAAVDERLAGFPDDPETLMWKMDLLLRHDRAADAWALFESKLKDRFVGPDLYLLTAPYPAGDHLGRYLFRLAAEGRTDETRTLLARLNEIRADVAAQAKDVRNARAQERARHARYLFDDPQGTLAAAMKIPAALDAFERSPKPAVTRIATSRDGALFYELELPTPPAASRDPNRGSGAADAMSYWYAVTSPGAATRGRQVMEKDGKTIIWAIDASHTGQLTLSGKAAAARLPHNADFQVLRDWSASAPVPPPTADTLDQLLAAMTPGADWSKSLTSPTAAKGETLTAQAHQALAAGRPAEAATLFRQALALPDDQWPAWYRDPVNGDLLARTRRTLRLYVARALAAQGKLEKAESAIAEVEKTDPPLKLDDANAISLDTEIRNARLESARYLIAHRRLDEAAALLYRLEATRPNIAELPNRHVTTRLGAGTQTWSVHTRLKDAWRDFDTVRWNLDDARAAQTPTAN